MSVLNRVVAALADFYEVRLQGDTVLVDTHCLYPSGQIVTVHVRGEGQTCSVSDGSGALMSMLDAGFQNHDQLASMIDRKAAQFGLLSDNGSVHAKPMDMGSVAAGIAVVANASRHIAGWLIEKIKVEKPDFKVTLKSVLHDRFNGAVHHNVSMLGFSNKEHLFENVIKLGERSIIVDPVLNESKSINSRLVANLDVRRMERPEIEQRIIYDDADVWGAAELNLLTIGAPVVAFTNATEVVSKIVNRQTLQ